MVKRRTQNSDDFYIESGDDPIGLTGAFIPVKGPQSVEYSDDDDPVGLTQAFGAIPDQDEQRSWDEANKWNNFDWNAGYEDAEQESDEAPAQPVPPEGEGEDPAVEPGQTGAVPVVEADAPAPAAATAASAGTAVSSAAPKISQRGRHAAPDIELSPRMKRSQRTRRVLIVLVVLLVVILGLVGVFAFKTVSQSQEESTHQAHENSGMTKEDVIEDISADAAGVATAQTDVPVLSSLFGKTTDEALEIIGHGAIVTQNREDTDKSTAVASNLNVALNDEPADSKTGTPTVYLGLDKNGKVIEIGYSASASALGFGSLSFADAVNTEHVIEKTFARIGFNVPEGSVKLPEDKSSYSTYAKDGTTVERERCTFENGIDVDGTACTWSAVLSYDYKTQITTGNLDDTIRIIYVYVSQNVKPEPEPEPSAEAAPAE